MKTGFKKGIEIEGLSLIGNTRGEAAGDLFRAYDPRTGQSVNPAFYSATEDEVSRAAQLSADAFPTFGQLNGTKRAVLLESIADNLESIRTEIVARASLETGLPTARFEGELGRTTGQLRMFSEIAAEASWVDARIDRAMPDRAPLPRPDIRSMLTPVGPVVVFCASNFPLAFSVAGGDTASALAVGCPVIVIAHTAHPGTAELAGKAIAKAVSDCGLDPGVFSLIFANGYDAGQSLVKNSLIKAVGFTGSRKGGRALMDIAAARTEPIPVFAEMSSINPLFILNNALESRTDDIADGLFTSYTLGYGQFCTKPGVVVLEASKAADSFIERLEKLISTTESSPLLTEGICKSFNGKVEALGKSESQETEDSGFNVTTSMSVISGEEFLGGNQFREEVFGPFVIIVLASSRAEIRTIAGSFEGQLTATVHGTEEEITQESDLLEILQNFAGRLVFNAFPTGVEVSGAIVHGGPYPATSNGSSTSVGKRAVLRFARLVAFQDAPENILPDALKDGNPLDIKRIEA